MALSTAVLVTRDGIWIFFPVPSKFDNASNHHHHHHHHLFPVTDSADQITGDAASPLQPSPSILHLSHSHDASNQSPAFIRTYIPIQVEFRHDSRGQSAINTGPLRAVSYVSEPFPVNIFGEIFPKHYMNKFLQKNTGEVPSNNS